MIISRCEKVYGSELDDQFCLFDSKSAKYYILNSTGSTIWRLLDEPIKFNNLLEKLLDFYEFEKEIIKKDVNEFLKNAIEIGILNKN